MTENEIHRSHNFIPAELKYENDGTIKVDFPGRITPGPRAGEGFMNPEIPPGNNSAPICSCGREMIQVKSEGSDEWIWSCDLGRPIIYSRTRPRLPDMISDWDTCHADPVTMSQRDYQMAEKINEILQYLRG